MKPIDYIELDNVEGMQKSLNNAHLEKRVRGISTCERENAWEEYPKEDDVYSVWAITTMCVPISKQSLLLVLCLLCFFVLKPHRMISEN